MRKLPTTLTAATAAALSALAVTVTVPAIGDDTPAGKAGGDPGAGAVKPQTKDGSRPDGKLVVREGSGPDEATIRACLGGRGVKVPDGDGRVLKEWIIAEHTAAEKQALKACGPPPDVKATDHAGPCGGAKPAGDEGKAAAVRARRG